MPRKLDVVCAHCGSDDFTADANAHWDVEGQCWTLGEVWEKGGNCGGCGHHDCKHEYKEIIDGTNDVVGDAPEQG